MTQLSVSESYWLFHLVRRAEAAVSFETFDAGQQLQHNRILDNILQEVKVMIPVLKPR